MMQNQQCGLGLTPYYFVLFQKLYIKHGTPLHKSWKTYITNLTNGNVLKIGYS